MLFARKETRWCAPIRQSLNCKLDLPSTERKNERNHDHRDLGQLQTAFTERIREKIYQSEGNEVVCTYQPKSKLQTANWIYRGPSGKTGGITTTGTWADCKVHLPSGKKQKKSTNRKERRWCHPISQRTQGYNNYNKQAEQEESWGRTPSRTST